MGGAEGTGVGERRRPSMRPMGRPSDENPQGTDTLGIRVRLKTRVMRSNASRTGTSSPPMSITSSPCRGAGVATVGVAMRSTDSNAPGDGAGVGEPGALRLRIGRGRDEHPRLEPAAHGLVHAVAVTQHAVAVGHGGLCRRDGRGERRRPLQLRDADAHHFGAELFEDSYRPADRGLHLSVERRPHVLLRHADAHPAHAAVESGEVVDHRQRRPKRGRAGRGRRARSWRAPSPRPYRPSGRRCRGCATAASRPPCSRARTSA